MKAIEVILFVDDEKLEKRIEALEIRCENLNIPLSNVLQAVCPKVPDKPYVDVLLSFADLEISDIEESLRMKHFFESLKKRKKEKKKMRPVPPNNGI